MSKRWGKIAVAVALILLPFAVAAVHQKLTALPKEITIAGGPLGGRYRVVTENLARAVEKKLDIKVRTISTAGSFQNLQLLESGEADFALYTAGTLEILTEAGVAPRPSGTGRAAFIANLDNQPAHLIVRRDAGIKSPFDLKAKTVHVGLEGSGSYAMSLVLLEHFGLSLKSVNAKHLSYAEIKRGFQDGTLDAAFIYVGVQAPILSEIFETGKCSILSIPFAEALATRHVGISEYRIPMGLYHSQPPAAPAVDIHTVAARTQLLTRSDVSEALVEEVTKIVLSEEFMKRNALQELFSKGRQFAQETRDFAIHPGAQRVYQPGLRPLLPSEFVQATEGIRSFVFALAIALFFGVRWLYQQRERKKAHKLHRYIYSLLAMEQRQLRLGSRSDVDDTESLQELLDRITQLKQEAFRNFSVHEINEDQAVSCFIQMCDGLSDKINAKLSRQRLHARFDELAARPGGPPFGFKHGP